ncbi:MAG: PQQ-binding-like beta-propeller repeat protein [Chitinophagales bacterium]
MRNSGPRFLQCLLLVAFFPCFFIACQRGKEKDYNTWGLYRGDEGSNAYSGLDQINAENVTTLKVAWTYHTGDKTDYDHLECNPIIIHDILYGISPGLKAFALNAKTGKELWIFDPFGKENKGGGYCRGLTYWRDNDEQRIFLFAANKLFALDAGTGKQIMDFGDSGYVDLNKGLRSLDGKDHREDVTNTSPGIIYKNLIITGSSVSENYESSPGHIRAYDVRTGKMKWIFHTIPEPGEFGYDTWQKDSYKTVGGCNAWSGLSIDAKRGIVFAATGTPAFDFHGGERTGQNLFGNSVIALNAATGKLVWYYQASHHDLWDYDLPSPPNLVTIKKAGKLVDAVAQITKQGYIFLFDRENGKPLFPIEEKPVAASKMPDEQTWPTQPVPSKPLPLCRQKFDENTITDISPEAHEYVLREAGKYASGNIYLPPSTEGIIQMPGFRGGAEWSGACVDMKTGILYAGINDIPNIVQLVENRENTPDESVNLSIPKAGNLFYIKNCSACHGENLKGNGQFPSLLQVEQRLKPDEAKNTIKKGRGMMPSFSKLPDEEINAIISYLFKLNANKKYENGKTGNPVAMESETRKRYSIKGYTQLLDQDGYPGSKPPWGTLNAVDLNSGDILWKVPLGQYPELAKKGIVATGTQLFGGGIVTAGGLIFIGASKDEKFRAIDKLNGKTLWEYQLPVGGYATPATYAVDGKQYVVIAAGGGGFQRTKTGDCYIAFALP